MMAKKMRSLGQEYNYYNIKREVRKVFEVGDGASPHYVVFSINRVAA